MNYFYQILETPLGQLHITTDDHAVLSVDFSPPPSPSILLRCTNTVLQCALDELSAYFAKQLQVFSVPVKPIGTEFQLRAWQFLMEIPYGTTRNYQQQASALGLPKAVRATGGANAKNPISIIIPCHRVIGKNGRLTGYAGGLERKKFLLDLEQNSNIQ